MSTFLTKDDYKGIISSHELEVITTDEENILTNEAVRKKAENFAISKISKLIGSKYDTQAIYSTIGEHRDNTIIEYTIYYTLNMLYGKQAKKNVPEDIYDSYNEAKDFFTGIFEGEMTAIGLPLLPDDSEDSEDSHRFGNSEYDPSGY